jgi:hypothetical protein
VGGLDDVDTDDPVDVRIVREHAGEARAEVAPDARHHDDLRHRLSLARLELTRQTR